MTGNVMLCLMIYLPPIILFIALSKHYDAKWQERHKYDYDYDEELFKKEIYEIYRDYANKNKGKQND